MPKYEENTGNKKGLKHEEKVTGAKTTCGVALKERLIGGNIKEIKGDEPAQARVSYFRGNDPSKWKTGIRTYGLVSLEEVYEGIDLKLKAYGNNVEKLFYVKPGAKAEAIAMSVEGANSLKVDEKTGELVAETVFGEVRFTKPVAYYLEEPMKKIEVSYKIEGNAYTFAISEYDRTKTIVIDPLLASTYIGGDSGEGGHSIALDSNGNVYVTGYTESFNYPTTTGAYDQSHNGGYDVFVSKLSNNLDTLLASTYIGGDSGEGGHSIALDSNGNVYVTGYTESFNYPTTTGAYDQSHNGGYDVFVSKLSNNLGTLLASTYIGRDSSDVANSIALDSNGNVYVAGTTWSSNYPATQGAYDTNLNGGTYDGFISKFNSSLNTLLASTFFGGSSGADGILSITIDSAGNVYVTGPADSSDFPTTAGAYDTYWNGRTDAFVSKFNNYLSKLLLSTYIGGSSIDLGISIALDSNGNVYVTGYTESFNYPTTAGAYDQSHNGGNDVFVSKLSNNLDTLLASTYIGGDRGEGGHSIALDSNGNVYVTGYTGSSNYPTTAWAYDQSHNGGNDVFVSKLSNNL
ncbi:MAG: SBBP repeat-containing protein, partial [Thermodesulforhabdaceae bacterium]